MQTAPPHRTADYKCQDEGGSEGSLCAARGPLAHPRATPGRGPRAAKYVQRSLTPPEYTHLHGGVGQQHAANGHGEAVKFAAREEVDAGSQEHVARAPVLVRHEPQQGLGVGAQPKVMLQQVRF
jgi:hypothetical protein